MGMEVSFFAACPTTGGLSVPHKSGPAGALRRGLPWRDNTGTVSCLVKITVFVEINILFQNQVWARGMRQKKTSPCPFPFTISFQRTKMLPFL
jgi:hypothetical protein